MIVTVFTIAGRSYVDFTTDFSHWYYLKPLIKRMWRVETLGM